MSVQLCPLASDKREEFLEMKARPVVIASFLLRVDFHDFRRRSGKARVKNARILPLSLFPHKILVTFIAVTALATFTFTLLPVGVLYLFHKRDYRACNPKRDDISLRRMSDKIRRLPNRSGIFFFFLPLSRWQPRVAALAVTEPGQTGSPFPFRSPTQPPRMKHE